MQKKKTPIHIPPPWADLILGVSTTTVFALIHCYVISNPDLASYGTVPLWLLSGSIFVMLFICTILMGGKHYSLDDEQITVRYFGIPVRTIRWISVSHAIYSHKWRENGKLRYATAVSTIKGNAIFVSLYACPPFDPENDIRADFAAIHPRTFLCIYLPAKDTKKYIDGFRRNYPDLKEQK